MPRSDMSRPNSASLSGMDTPAGTAITAEIDGSDQFRSDFTRSPHYGAVLVPIALLGRNHR